jgi:hypothetical protein
MRLAVAVDVVAIAARIAIILPSADDRSQRTAENRACDRSSPGAETRKDGAGDGSDTRADSGSCGRACNDVVIGRRGGATAQSKAARGGDGNYETIHLHALQG